MATIFAQPFSNKNDPSLLCRHPCLNGDPLNEKSQCVSESGVGLYWWEVGRDVCKDL